MKIVNNTEILEPSECFFAAVDHDDDVYAPTLIFITDKETWNSDKCLSDNIGYHSFDDNIIPESIDNIMEAVWESQLSVDKVKEILSKIGFVYCSEMESLIDDYV